MCFGISPFQESEGPFMQLPASLQSPCSIPYLSNSGQALCTSYWPVPRLLSSPSCKTAFCQAFCWQLPHPQQWRVECLRLLPTVLGHSHHKHWHVGISVDSLLLLLSGRKTLLVNFWGLLGFLIWVWMTQVLSNTVPSLLALCSQRKRGEKSYPSL